MRGLAKADDDVDLMLRVRGGDPDAFEALVRRYQKRAVSTAYRFLGDAALAQDAAQEAFLRLFRARERYQPKAGFATFFYRILANQCYSMLRAKRDVFSLDAAASEDGSPLEASLPDPASPAPDAHMDRQERAQTVRRAVDALPENQRMALLLFRFQSLSYREIADTLGTSEKAVKSLLARARSTLKETLARYAPG